MESLGFIILRHVSNLKHAHYYKLSYERIRKYYPENYIIMIDDNSNPELIDENENLYKTVVIKSEYPGRGELLPYIFYLKNKLFDTAVIIHDSVFLNSNIDFSVTNYKFLLEFNSFSHSEEYEIHMIKHLNQSEELLALFLNRTWKGCFGCMCIIKYDFLEKVNQAHDFEKLIPLITNREHRCCFERVLACMLQLHGPKECLLGDLYRYCRWAITYEEMSEVSHLPLIKVWSGR